MELAFIFPMKYIAIWLGVVLAAIAGLLIALRLLERRHSQRVRSFIDMKLAPRLLADYNPAVRRPLIWLTLAGFAAIAVALAQPHWGRAWQDVRKQSRDILILLDTSESMRAANPLPSRMDRSKQKLSMLLDRAPGDRFGIIAFSGNAALQCPLTLDHGYVRAVLNAMDSNVVSLEGTDIAAALREAVRVLEWEDRESGFSSKAARAILLVSDGEQISGDAVQEAELASQYARIFVLGIGDPQGTEIRIPEYLAKYGDRSRSDAVHLSKLDETTLMRVASAGNGAYARSRADRKDIDDLFQRFETLATRDVAGELRFEMVNRYQWPLAIAILCFAGEGIWLAAIPWVRWWKRQSAVRRESIDVAV